MKRFLILGLGLMMSVMSFGQLNPRSETPSLISPLRIILEQDTGVFFTWEEEQVIIAKLIYKDIYKDDLEGALELWRDERRKLKNTEQALQVRKAEVARLEATIRMGEARLKDADAKKTAAEQKYLKENKKKRRWRRISLGGITIGAGGGILFGMFLAQ